VRGDCGRASVVGSSRRRSPERDKASDEELRLLLRGGSSLGGARPKAHVIDPRGRASIAKFPSRADDWDVVAWEAVAHELAKRAGIKVPPAELHRIDGKSVFITERFDRSAAGERIGYVSAMTMLEAGDRDPRSYLEIAEVIESESPRATEDLRELWSRSGLFILISNTDDHLRNHGFLKTIAAGWELAPAFDINPNPQAAVDEFATPIDDESERTIDVLIGVADYFRIREDQARLILVNLGEVTSHWRAVAAALGLGKDAVEEMAPAFENHQSTAVRALGPSTSPPASSPTRQAT
jgi:serine/threonine-protein kinase HipA